MNEKNGIQIVVGKFTNSYRHHLGEYATDGYTFRVAEQVDETCFENPYVFNGLIPAMAKLIEVLEFTKETAQEKDAIDLSCALANAICVAMGNDLSTF